MLNLVRDLTKYRSIFFLNFSERNMCGSFTCSKNTLVGLNVIYILVSFLIIGVAVHSKFSNLIAFT